MLLPFIPDKSTSFAPCGPNIFFMFSGDVAASGASDQFALINVF